MLGKMDSRCAIHCNPYLKHQVRWAEAFANGFRRHGQACEITSDASKPADIHVVLGPHYALEQWRHHPNCIWLDRAFWGDPECASIGWSTGDGRRFPLGEEQRPHPELHPWKIGLDAIVLADYGDDGASLVAMARPHFDRLDVRRHPVQGGSGTLTEALAGYQIAIGRKTSALIEAAILGLSVVCLEQDNPVALVATRSVRDIGRPDRGPWIHQLSWGNWSVGEIENGEVWECLTTRCN